MNLQQKKPLVSIVILTYNSAEFVETCLESLANQTYPNYEIIVVDNASRDHTLARLAALSFSPEPKIITNKENLGCAGGNNVGWRASSGEVIVFLNPDTVVTKRWLETLVNALMSNAKAAIAGCKIYYPNSHRIQHAGGILYPNGMSDHRGNGAEDVGQFDEQCEMDYVTGAALAVRRSFLEQVGGLDEDYVPAYYEETDLCYKAHKHGLKVIYVPEALLYHYESPALKKLSRRFYEMYYRNRIRFVIKNYSLWEVLTKFLPYEVGWMLFEPRAKGLRLRQFRAYWQGFKFLLTHRR